MSAARLLVRLLGVCLALTISTTACDEAVPSTLDGGSGPCAAGYVQQDGVCVDVDECLVANGGCGDQSFYSCTNNPGAPPTCGDIDECTLVPNGACDPSTTCTNQGGAFRICSACPAGTSSATGTGVSPCGLCPPGSFAGSPGSTSCTVCPSGWSGSGASACTPWSSPCVAGQYESTLATVLIDRECSPCPDGTFSGPNAKTCTHWTTCTANEYEVSPGSASADRVCASTSCPPDFTVDAITAVDSTTNFQWQRATGPFEDWNGAISYCADLVLGGYTDWRLPTHAELASLYVAGSAPYIDTCAFPDTNTSWAYWTATEWGTDEAFVVNFASQQTGALKTMYLPVRCVR